jgi:hypothetical protein
MYGWWLGSRQKFPGYKGWRIISIRGFVTISIFGKQTALENAGCGRFGGQPERPVRLLRAIAKRQFAKEEST